MNEGAIYLTIAGFVIWLMIAFSKSSDGREKEQSKKRENEFGYAEREDNKKGYNELAESRWPAFLAECTATVPHSSKHKKAALFRHAWKRAHVLKGIYQSTEDLENMLVHENFIKFAENSYSHVAPQNMYGEVGLKMSYQQEAKLYEIENKRLFPEALPTKPKEFSCIYRGVDTATKRTYIGQTTNEAEERWLQHRKSKTGAFKDGAINVNWEVLREQVPFDQLDYWESYYIGYYNSVDNGFNDNRGNDLSAYQKGLKDFRVSQK
jgi:hypothetical protein